MPPGRLKIWNEDAQEWEYPPGGSQPGSQPYTGPFTIYALQSQAIDASGDPPDAGTLTVAYDGVESDPINATDNAAAITAALEAIPALTGKVEVTGELASGENIVTILLDGSLEPFELFTIANNSLTASAAPVADPLIYAGGGTTTDLLTPTAGQVVEDFIISVPQNEAFGSGSEISWAPEDGEADWPQNFGLALDSEDGSDKWTISQDSDGPLGCHSASQAIAASVGAGEGNYPTLPAVCNVPSAIQANVSRNGQGTAGIVLVWVKLGGVAAPS